MWGKKKEFSFFRFLIKALEIIRVFCKYNNKKKLLLFVSGIITLVLRVKSIKFLVTCGITMFRSIDESKFAYLLSSSLKMFKLSFQEKKEHEPK